MNKFFTTFFVGILLSTALFAKSYLVSPIPLPKTYIQNIDPQTCDLICLDDMLQKGEIFSFIAHIKDIQSDESTIFKEDLMIYSALFNLGGEKQEQNIQIALLLPSKKIGRYAYTITNSVFAYMLAKNRDFKLKTFEIENEKKESIDRVLEDIYAEGINYTIAALTPKGAQNLIDLNRKQYVFIPTINKSVIKSNGSAYIYYGGIDYKKQLEKLMQISAQKLVIFYSQSKLGSLLNQYTQEEFYSIHGNLNQTDLYPISIGKKRSTLKDKLKNNQKIQWASFVVNTPVVKTGMILSQLTLHDINSTNILSTQINYDPIIFAMTQYKDRKNLYLTNSISEQNRVITEANALLNNDIEYDWINYATTLGVDYFYHLMSLEPREYTTPFIDQQLNYPVVLLKAGYSRFEKVKE